MGIGYLQGNPCVLLFLLRVCVCFAIVPAGEVNCRLVSRGGCRCSDLFEPAKSHASCMTSPPHMVRFLWVSFSIPNRELAEAGRAWNDISREWFRGPRESS